MATTEERLAQLETHMTHVLSTLPPIPKPVHGPAARPPGVADCTINTGSGQSHAMTREDF